MLLCGPFAVKFIMGLRLGTNENGMAARRGRLGWMGWRRNSGTNVGFIVVSVAMGIYEIPRFCFYLFAWKGGPWRREWPTSGYFVFMLSMTINSIGDKGNGKSVHTRREWLTLCGLLAQRVRWEQAANNDNEHLFKLWIANNMVIALRFLYSFIFILN